MYTIYGSPNFLFLTSVCNKILIDSNLLKQQRQIDNGRICISKKETFFGKITCQTAINKFINNFSLINRVHSCVFFMSRVVCKI
jgi:hypothetical protein